MSDGNDIVERLTNTALYGRLEAKLKAQASEVRSATLDLVHSAAEYCQNKLKTVVRYMPSFTLHDETHVFNILGLMDRLIPEPSKSELSAPEIVLLILSAFFHDIGMAPDEESVRAWKKQWASDHPSPAEAKEHSHYEQFRLARPEKSFEIQRLLEAGEHKRAELVEESLVSEFIRDSHAERTRQLIARDWNNRVVYKNTDLTSELAELCLSHNQNAIKLLDMNPVVLCDEDEYVCIPFVGVILRLADLLDFDPKRTPAVLFSHLSIRDPISIAEWKKHRSITAWKISSQTIVYSARCKHPSIEASIRKFCDMIDIELRDCSHVLAHISDVLIEHVISRYRISLPASVDRSKIEPEKDISTGKPLYRYRDTQFTLSKTQVIDLLMGTKLYGSTDVALRELIQNSIDACGVRQHMESYWATDYAPHVVVRYMTDKGDDVLEVEDNGIGMNQHIIDSYYSNIGSSFYRSTEFYELMSGIGGRYEPISRFGIGILSCFMVSDSVDVQTRKLNPDQELDEPINLRIEGYDSIFHIQDGERKQPGTITRLTLRPENPWKRMSHERFIQTVRSSVPNPPFEIVIETDKETVHHSADYFGNIDPSDLTKNDWAREDNIRTVPIKIDEPSLGFQGRAIVGILDQDGEPVDKVEVLSKMIEIDGQDFELSLCLNYDTNEIEKRTTSIDVTDDGGIDQSDNYSVVAKSRSAFSIHGIAFPDGLFRGYSIATRQAEIRWPFPILLVLDVADPTDIELNTSRTEIINNKGWQQFEVDLAQTVTKLLLSSVERDYALRLLPILESKDQTPFQKGLSKAVGELAL